MAFGGGGWECKLFWVPECLAIFPSTSPSEPCAVVNAKRRTHLYFDFAAVNGAEDEVESHFTQIGA